MPNRTRIIVLKKTLQKHIISLCSELGLGGYEVNHTELRFGLNGSLSVSLVPGSVGIWKSFETGQGGDIIDLISHTLGLDFVDTMRWIETWLCSQKLDSKGGDNE